jgi:hypothetical protein
MKVRKRVRRERERYLSQDQNNISFKGINGMEKQLSMDQKKKKEKKHKYKTRP